MHQLLPPVLLPRGLVSHKAQKNLSLTPKFGKSEKVNHVSQIKGDVAYRSLRIPIVGEELQGEQSKIRDSPFLSSPALFSSEIQQPSVPAGSIFRIAKNAHEMMLLLLCVVGLPLSATQSTKSNEP